MTITVGRLLAFISVLAAMAIAAIILVSSLDHESGKAARGSSPVAPLLKKAQKVSTIDPIRSIQKEIAEDQFGSSSCSISKNGTGLSVDVLGAEASSECDSLTRQWSDATAYWEAAPGAETSGTSPICAMIGRDNGHLYALTVRDYEPLHQDGTELCGEMAGRGGLPVERLLQADLRAAITSIEAFYFDHNSYSGVSAGALRKSYDSGLASEITVTGSGQHYCAQATFAGIAEHVNAEHIIDQGTC